MLVSAALVAAVLSPFLVDFLTSREIERLARLGVYAHYSPAMDVAPAFVVTLQATRLHRFGFPFRYFWGSDASIIVNGTNLNAGTSGIALVANIAALFTIVVALACAYRRSLKPQPPAPRLTV